VGRSTVSWHFGNAAHDGQDTRGWILGHFIEPDDSIRSTQDVEVKWGIHPAGDKRPEWTKDDQRTTLVLLISGHFVVSLTDGTAELRQQGDYVMWGPGIDHSWEAYEDSVVMTVRWPSTPLPTI
jgi:hypothetical protein